MGNEKKEPFKFQHLGTFYSCLVSHFSALVAKDEGENARNLYTKSILSMPEYFKYADKWEDELKELYKASYK